MSTFRRLLEAFLPGRRLREQLARAPMVLVADVREGTIQRITGTARPFDKQLLVAPLSQRVCLHYALRVAALRIHDGRIMPTKLVAENRHRPFVLEDESGRAIIDLAHANLLAPFDRTVSGRIDELSDEAREVIASRGLEHHDWSRYSAVRVSELVILPDTPLTVAGIAVSEPDPESTSPRMYRDGIARRPRFVGTAAHPLIAAVTT